MISFTKGEEEKVLNNKLLEKEVAGWVGVGAATAAAAEAASHVQR